MLFTELNIHLAHYTKVSVDLYEAAAASGPVRNPPRSRRSKIVSYSRPGEHVKQLAYILCMVIACILNAKSYSTVELYHCLIYEQAN